ncbi:hypothetical protein KSP40_PGU011035 [Platanthera guangdongensis]|uniref:Uncharacterized protein n=1 Tax=Platanthera guangdongensis TaxID=2320717 RepID=A0ABR2MTJ8_9ASPA
MTAQKIYLFFPNPSLAHPSLMTVKTSSPSGLLMAIAKRPVENEEGPRIFLSRVLLEAPLSPLKKSGSVSLG